LILNDFNPDYLIGFVMSAAIASNEGVDFEAISARNWLFIACFGFNQLLYQVYPQGFMIFFVIRELFARQIDLYSCGLLSLMPYS
jgi:hypothetical protein